MKNLLAASLGAAFHVPREHTDGDTLVDFRKADVVHMADVHFNGLDPFIDASRVTANFDDQRGKGYIPPATFAEMIAKNYIRNAP